MEIGFLSRTFQLQKAGKQRYKAICSAFLPAGVASD
jgi:hypothetical protein